MSDTVRGDAPNTARRDPRLDDLPMAELLKRLSEQTSTLVRQELDLAKAELTVKGKRMGAGAGMFGGAGRVRRSTRSAR